MTYDREGFYNEWTWNSLRKCWEYFTPHSIYPIGDKFTVSSCEVWHGGCFDSFDEAERAALGIETQNKEG